MSPAISDFTVLPYPAVNSINRNYFKTCAVIFDEHETWKFRFFLTIYERRFSLHADVVQLLEQLTCNEKVVRFDSYHLIMILLRNSVEHGANAVHH